MQQMDNFLFFATSGVPELPGRPGPGHPLYHHMMKAAHGVALHDFTGSQHDELSFKVCPCKCLLWFLNTFSWAIIRALNRHLKMRISKTFRLFVKRAGKFTIF